MKMVTKAVNLTMQEAAWKAIEKVAEMTTDNSLQDSGVLGIMLMLGYRAGNEFHIKGASHKSVIDFMMRGGGEPNAGTRGG